MSRYRHAPLRCVHDKAMQTFRAASLNCHRLKSKRGDYATPRAQRCKHGCWNLDRCSRCCRYCSFLYSPASLYSANQQVPMVQKYPEVGTFSILGVASRPLASIGRRMQRVSEVSCPAAKFDVNFQRPTAPPPTGSIIVGGCQYNTVIRA